MDKNSILFLTKDAVPPCYLPCYGNEYWKGKTPNLDELVSKGTLFTNAFTAAPSSAMSYLTMFTRKYPYQQEIQKYVPVLKPYEGPTLFDYAYDMGFECHVVWDEHWIELAQRYSECYGKRTIMHPMEGLREGVGPAYKREVPLKRSKEKEDSTFMKFQEEINKITSTNNKIFLWCHLPHVLNGRISYCDDIDLFDRYLGYLRKHFDDSNIFVSADHGNMNGMRGKIRYGFDVYDTAIRIPLITPRLENKSIYEEQFCNIDIFELLFERKIVKREYIYSDCAYYAQPKRKLAIVYGKYRYIYNKKDKTEELYDVSWDPHQDFSLMSDYCFDVDRKMMSPARELFFYPYWDELPEIRDRLRKEKDKIWREETRLQRITSCLKKYILHNSLLTRIVSMMRRRR